MNTVSMTTTTKTNPTRLAMWGPLVYPAVDKDYGVSTIAEATYRYIHGEIDDPGRYQDLMEAIMDNNTKSGDSTTHEMKTSAYKKVVNLRYFGKTAIESFVAMEIAVRIAREDTPNVGFRRILRRTFLGLIALQQTVGPWVDTSNEMIYKYGVSDTSENIASACKFFPSLYTKVMMGDECIVSVAAVHKYTAKNSCEPLVDSILFDYIKMLFPSTSAIPYCDKPWLAHKFMAMKTRASVLEGDEIAHACKAGFFDFMRTIMYLGTNLSENVTEVENALIVKTNTMLPFLQASMNHAMRVSSYRL